MLCPLFPPIHPPTSLWCVSHERYNVTDYEMFFLFYNDDHLLVGQARPFETTKVIYWYNVTIRHFAVKVETVLSMLFRCVKLESFFLKSTNHKQIRQLTQT